MHNQLPSTHQAIVRHDYGVSLRRVETPAIGPGELLLAPLVAGLCGTDIQMLRGLRNDPAAVIGHEGIAKIVSAGANCPPPLVPGRLVLVNPTHPHDTHYLLGHYYDGLFQEYIRIPAAVVSAGLVVPLDEIPPVEMAPLIEPLAAVLYAFELLQPQEKKQPFIIYGDGIIGHLAVLLARLRFGSALPIIFVHHHQEGLEWSRKHNVHGDIDLLFDQLSTHGALLDTIPAPGSALLATPRTSTLACLAHAIEFIAPQGVIDILGGVANAARLPSIPNVDIAGLRAMNCGGLPEQGIFTETTTTQNKPLVLCGHRGVSNQHLLQSVRELITHRRHYATVISHMLDLKEAAEFMHQLFLHGKRQIDGQRVMKLGIRINTQEKRHDHDN